MRPGQCRVEMAFNVEEGRDSQEEWTVKVVVEEVCENCDLTPRVLVGDGWRACRRVHRTHCQ